jgi:ATP-dependent exoDNAse (exonuclease V) beta subunit
MLYVATTRPKQSLHLLLTVPEADMHSRTIASFDQSVGKLLYQYAEEKGTKMDLPDYLQVDSSLACSYYTFSDSIVVPSLSKDKLAKQPKHVQLLVKSADQPISLRVNSAKSDLYTASSTKREIGNRLHDLLAQLPDFDAWQEVKLKSKVDVSLIDELFTDIKVQGFFKKENLAFKEVDLLCPDGTIVRPDRVNRVGDALQVIDFKTGKSKPEHDEQIARYKQTLQSMGHQVTEGVLIYLETKELRYV